jgi:hypothetical protein
MPKVLESTIQMDCEFVYFTIEVVPQPLLPQLVILLVCLSTMQVIIPSPSPPGIFSAKNGRNVEY